MKYPPSLSEEQLDALANDIKGASNSDLRHTISMSRHSMMFALSSISMYEEMILSTLTRLATHSWINTQTRQQ